MERYQRNICPPNKGEVLKIEGIGNRDAYNPALYEDIDGTKILAVRVEDRDSSAYDPKNYHPQVLFAKQTRSGSWKITDKLNAFDMMEDPFVFYTEEKGVRKVIFGAVWVHSKHNTFLPHTEFYKGETLDSLERIPFAIIDDMKDVRLLQLPDKRFLLCRRPQGDKYARGRITLHIIDNLDDLADVNKIELKTLAMLDSCQDALDGVGVNELRIVKDHKGHAWVGMLGHISIEDEKNNLHYAACTYKISLKDLLDGKFHDICPNVIATRACFESAPVKAERYADVVFPGHLEHVSDYKYRLWAGLSDARVGVIELDDPFNLKEGTA